MPKLTNRFSAIIGGNEYQVSNQLRRKSGAYSRQKRNGELQTEFNLEKGANFSLQLDPQRQIFYLILGSGTRKYRLYTILSMLNMPDSEMKKEWGKELFDINKKGFERTEVSELTDLYKKLVNRRAPSNFKDITSGLREYFKSTKMNGEVNKITLGKAHVEVTPSALIDASRRLLNINKGTEKQDERDSLIFKNIYSTDDLLNEYFKAHTPTIQNKLKNALRNRDQVREVVPSNLFTKSVRTFFTTSDLSSTPPQTNPVSMVTNSRKTTSMGEGGIQNMHSITMDTRDVQPSSFGFLDSLSTPESLKVGVSIGLASEVVKKGKDMATPVITKSGTEEYKTPMDMYESVVGFPDQFKLVNGKPKAHNPKEVKVMNRHKPGIVPESQVDYYLRAPASLFDFGSNMVPYLANTQGNRGSTAARMITQALPLDNPETPLTVTRRDKDTTYEDLMGTYMLPSLEQETGDSKIGGEVKKIDDGYIHIKGDDNKDYKVGLYKDFSLNEDGFINTKPIVEVGDKVKGTDLLAKSNYTDEDGRLALGRNLTVAYVSYKGNSFEDGATITESAAKKLTHTNIERKNIYFNPKLSVFNFKKFKAVFPEELERGNASKLGAEGLPKVGETFQEGEALAAFVVKKELDDLDISFKKLSKATYTPYSKNVTRWEESDPGTVVDVRKTGRNIDIYVKSTHPFKEGDKLSSRYGDKHIVGKIIPDDDAPHRPDGTPVDIMVNPQGVQGRMNMGQLIDTAAGKLAKKRGEPIVVENFEGEDVDVAKKIYGELKKEGIEPDEILTDGKNGKPLKNPVFVGDRQYIKLRHLVKKKQNAHSFGNYDINEQPSKGPDGNPQKIGKLDTYALLAHGSKNLLREINTIKGRKNEEYMRDLQMGIPPGRPSANFAFDKMVTYMQASGVDVNKEGNRLQLIPLTDKKVSELSKGALKDPGAMLIGKNLASRKGGLFDKKITGGTRGDNYSHIELPRRLPNPMAETAIKSVLNLTNKDYDSIMSGKSDLNGEKGPDAIIGALDNIDIQKSLKETQAELKEAPASKVNKLNTKVRILDALDKKGLNAKDAYTMSKALVIPPKFRPVYPLPSGDLQVSDINKHYRDVGLQARGLKEALDEDILTDEDAIDYSNNLYRSIKAMQGFVDPITYGKQKYKGALKDLGHTKKGIIFATAWEKRQDLSGRSTITPEPSLGLDSVGIPEGIAKNIYKPFMVKKLKETGMSARESLKEVNEHTPRARKAMQDVMRSKPVLLNRAPTLHKHSFQAFKPQLTEGKEIRLNPLVVSGYNADFDGDEQINSVIVFILDKDLENYYLSHSQYNKQFWKDREIMASRLNVKLPYAKDGKFYLVNLEDFPYKEDRLLGQKDHIDFYAAEDHINVIAYDEVNNKLVLAKAQGWSYHKQREIWTVDLSDKSQIITDDDPRAVYGIDPQTLQMVRETPENSKGLLVPKSDYAVNLDVGMKKLSVVGTGKLKPEIKLNKEVGYVIGSLAGDGWVDTIKGKPNRVNIAGIELNCFSKYKESLSHIFKKIPNISHTIMTKSYGQSEKRIISSVDFAEWVLPLIGKGAKNKHLPPFWFTATDEFKWGLFSGLLDTDGSVSVNRSKKTPQLQANISSISIRLLQETQQMLKTLGIRSRISFSKKTQADNDFWILSISSPDLAKHRDKLFTAHEKNIEALGTYVQKDSKSAMRNDYVPFNQEIRKYVNSTEKSFHSKHRSLYVTMARDVKKGRITRFTAKKILELPNVDHSKLPKAWIDIINNEDITWVSVKKVTNTGKKEDGYDLTVPGYETFLSVDGIVLSNTMSVHVPVTFEGEEEAKSMFPSNILFKHGDKSLVPSISQEYTYGVSKLSEIGKDTGKSFKNINEAKGAGLDMTDVFTIDGKKMTIGQ